MTRLVRWLERWHRRNITRYSTRHPKPCISTKPLGK